MQENTLRKVVKKIAPNLKYHDISELIPILKNRALAFFLEEKWDLPLLKEVGIARSFFKKVERSQLKRVFIFSYSRSGTHNFVSRFHYLPCAFCFREHAFETKKDPFQLRMNGQNIKSSHFLSLSMFREYGLQDKKGNELSHLFFLNNRFLEYPKSISTSQFDTSNDKIIFYVRNIFRTLYSRHKSGIRMGKPKPRFEITDERFEFALRQHKRKLMEMYQLKTAYPRFVTFCFHEAFCGQPQETMEDICAFLDIPSMMLKNWDSPEIFFNRCYGDKISPVTKHGKLWCRNRQQYILGTGGKFNPLTYPNLDRTMQDPMEKFLSTARLKLSRKILGTELTDFWVNDENYVYGRESASHILEMIGNCIGVRQKSDNIKNSFSLGNNHSFPVERS